MSCHDCEGSSYSSDTVAPRASKVFFSFSASSFGRLSLRVLGTDSTNFFACLRDGRLHHRQGDSRGEVGISGDSIDVDNGQRRSK